MTCWQVQEAKNKFSEVIERASHGETQIITRHGLEVAAVVSIERYKQLTKPKQTLVEFLSSSPLADSGLVITRVQGEYRAPVEL
ncbi:MAG TPA: type II toxin-antitoxin system prevent-host-death family antitoxin [Chloroflexi bacterium]|nr:type II toxin-antitoxin system prevent-host-death family antitoxin [Chloroflexota bacterium]HHW86848.1 type II toxin-antitoxin system Phd/YefM family antitoxin [Chloroflexota bacterium]